VFNNPYSQEIFTALYDPQQGLGLTFLRIENAIRWYTGLPLDPRMPEFIQAATATAGKAPILVMTEGSPPANLKGNGTLNGTFANDPLNTLVKVNGQYDYADFAQYWMDSLKSYAAIGVVPDMISIQNEPDFYGSVQFNPSEAPYRGTTFAGYAEAFDAVYRKLQTMATPPKMIGPELWSPNQGAPLAYAQALNAKEVYAFAHHLYDVDPNDTDPDRDLTDLSAYAQAMNATLPGVPRFQDEYFENNGFDTAWAIHNDLVEGGDNAYFYWALTWPNTPTDQEGLIYVDSAANPRSTWQYPHGWAAQDNYYAFKHFSLFVRPGYTLYLVTVDNPDERVSSYASADGKTVVVVLLNTSASATDTVALDLSKLNVTGSTVYRSTFSVALTVAGAERWNNLGALPTGDTVTLAPNAVATVVLTIG
jgi:glucuronoarabinoxylan endo-1,4-beta-xylanase